MVIVFLELFRSKCGRYPELLESSRGIVARRHDADDGVGQTIDFDGLAECAVAVSETISPDGIADDHDTVLSGLRFVGAEDAAGSGSDVEDLEEVRGNSGALDAFGKSPEGNVEKRKLDRSDRGNRLGLLTPVVPVSNGD